MGQLKEALLRSMDSAGEDADMNDLIGAAQDHYNKSDERPDRATEDEPEGDQFEEEYEEEPEEDLPEDEEYEGEEEPEPDEEQEDQPGVKLVDFEHYGKTYKVEEDAVKFIRQHHTQKLQEIAEMRKEAESELQSRIEEIERREREAAEKWEYMDRVLQENPEFAETWKRVQMPTQVERELKELNQWKQQFEEQQKLQAAQDRILKTFESLEQSNPIESDVLDQETIRKLVGQEYINSNGAIPIETIWAELASKLNGKSKKKATGYLKNKVRQKKNNPVESRRTRGRGGNSRRRTRKPAKKPDKKGPASLKGRISSWLDGVTEDAIKFG